MYQDEKQYRCEKPPDKRYRVGSGLYVHCNNREKDVAKVN
jgi:hypothetical protein